MANEILKTSDDTRGKSALRQAAENAEHHMQHEVNQTRKEKGNWEEKEKGQDRGNWLKDFGHCEIVGNSRTEKTPEKEQKNQADQNVQNKVQNEPPKDIENKCSRDSFWSSLWKESST